MPDSFSKPSDRSLLGSEGEALAAEHLERNGYRIVLTNFRVPVGRNSKGVQVTGEIDIVAIDGDTLCFVEVKTRRSEEFTPAITAVDARKQRQITRTAKIYRRVFGVYEMPHRFDVVTVVIPITGEISIEIAKAFWDEGKFRKRSWHREFWQEYF
jgi:putative endonuclease